MSLFKSPERKLHEDQEIALLVAEMNAGYLDDIAWAKAFQKAKGDADYANSIYIDERLYRIKEIYPLQKYKEQVTAQEKLLALELEKLQKKQQKAKTEIKEFKVWSILCVLIFGSVTIVLSINGETQFAVFGLFATCSCILVSVVWEMLLKKRVQSIDDEI